MATHRKRRLGLSFDILCRRGDIKIAKQYHATDFSKVIRGKVLMYSVCTLWKDSF